MTAGLSFASAPDYASCLIHEVPAYMQFKTKEEQVADYLREGIIAVGRVGGEPQERARGAEAARG